MANDLEIKGRDPSLYNEDLAPIPMSKRTWGWFEIFNVWANDVQSLFGYTLAASLFLSYGLNGWSVFAAILIAGFFVMWLVNLMGKPSVEYGIPFPVMARASMGVRGANFPAIVRAIVAIFWYGAQTYFASTAVALLIHALVGDPGEGAAMFLGMTGIDWVAFLLVWAFQIWLFWNGIDWIARFLNWAGPFVYLVMILLAGVIWYKAGGGLLTEMGNIFQGTSDYDGSTFGAFMAVVGTMIAYFAAVVINYGDFSRFVRSEAEMKKGNLLGLPLNIAFFSLIALIVTAGTVVVFGESLTEPTEIIERVDSVALTVVAAIMFFAATVGINLVANFIPPAYDLANLMPSKISFRVGGLITSGFALIIGGLWVSTISQIGIFNFVNTLGAILAPVYGIMIVDYYMIKGGKLDVENLFSADPSGEYFYDNGWNKTALITFALAGVFSVATVWVPALSVLSGFAWVIGAALGGGVYWVLAKR
ncbi:NCS1 family nucleobase:cation symporter-1 [Roseibium sp.]|uniref:NCS1 family nucleobase:cation symporter-1 n=1 Tax=Roseibium sp. TaxID=1936156 RepID=UPI003A97F0F5